MRHANGIGRLGLLAVGLGIGAAMAATPGTAAADDMQISIDGIDLFPTVGNTATAMSGLGDIAIAIGANSDATATGGIFDTAFADGTGSDADAMNGNLDTATVFGTGGEAVANGGSLDTVTAIGANSDAGAGFGILDSATVVGNFSAAEAAFGNGDLASVDTSGASDIADAGGFSPTHLGSNDIAVVVGTSTAAAGSDLASNGDFDLAVVFGDMLNASAQGSNFLVDIVP